MAGTRERRTLPAELGALLRGARERAGLSVRQAALKASVSFGYLANLEAGTRCPSLRVAEQIAAALQLGDGEREQLLGAAVTDAGRNSPWHAAQQPGPTSPTTAPRGAV